MPDDLSIDRARGLLFHSGRVFDLAARRWTATSKLDRGEPTRLRQAVRWLQTESGSPCRAPVAVIGPRDANLEARQTAFLAGAGLASLGLVLHWPS